MWIKYFSFEENIFRYNEPTYFLKVSSLQVKGRYNNDFNSVFIHYRSCLLRALLGKNERQLCPGAALQGGVGDVVLDQPGDALGVAVGLLHQRHVVACA